MNTLLNMTDLMESENDFIPILSSNTDELTQREVPDSLPILTTRNTVLYPGVVIPITAARAKSLQLVKDAFAAKSYIGVVAQKDKSKEGDPLPDEVYSIGTMAMVMQTMQMPDNTTVAVIQGVRRIRIKQFTQTEPYLKADVEPFGDDQDLPDNGETQAAISTFEELAKQLLDYSPQFPKEFGMLLKNVKSTRFLINLVTSMLEADAAEKQKVVECPYSLEQVQMINDILTKELQRLELKQHIQGKVRSEMDKQYREHVLNEQLKTIQQELGGSQVDMDVKELQEKGAKKNWTEEVAEVFGKELSKLQRLHSASPDYSTQLNYLNVFVDLPWGEYTSDNFDLQHAEKVLDADHFGLQKVKERIIEHIAVLKIKKDLQAPILCLLGPPGVGKTSLGKSLAAALGRKYVRMSLGGLHDESEIRGHRRTYIGAMPGRILANLKKTKSANPVFVLDEIDKIAGMNVQGDPAAALLEVLDPEQNSHFHDNFLDVDFDLSKVLFVATANSLSSIHPALIDRMEVIDISGYVMEEKVEIAKRHLLPQQLLAHGLKKSQMEMTDEALHAVIERYTRESGVRQLDKQVAKLVRSRARRLAEQKKMKKSCDAKEVEDVLGTSVYEHSQHLDANFVGVVTGLAWTAVGGEILFIEAALSRGTGQLTMTGNLGQVMKESATLAFEYLKANAVRWKIFPQKLEKYNLHIHVPEGATPKDGPSAGIAMFTAMLSVYLNKRVKSDFAMTGEITLRGQVAPVGGIREKILAAKRAHIGHIILCKENKRHVDEIPQTYLEGLQFHYVEKMHEVPNLVF